jgi:hypothetical protein
VEDIFGGYEKTSQGYEKTPTEPLEGYQNYSYWYGKNYIIIIVEY